MNDKIKVVEFVTRLEFGGVEAMLLNYISHFKNPEQFNIHIITQDINDEDCVRQFKNIGCTVHVVTHKRKSIPQNIKEIYRIMKREKYDVVHSHMTLTNFYVLFLARLLGVPMRISHSHSAFSDTGIKAKLIYPILKRLNKIAANVWIACGYNAGVFLYGKKVVHTGKVYSVYNAIDLKQFQYDVETRRKIREQHGIGNSLLVGHIGRFMTPKNHLFLINIFSELLKINSNAKLLLIGEGEMHDQIYNQVSKLHLKENVIFTGNIANTYEYYQAMDAFVLPSLYEGLPVVTIEAQAAGLPCLISDKVDKHCAMTPCIKFLSIEKSAQEWAYAILHSVESGRDYSGLNELTRAGYSIEVEAHKLEKLYKTNVFQ